MSCQTEPIVSRETTERLKLYVELLRKWNPKINLVSRATLDDAWSRHIIDSAQIYQIADHPVDHWVDLGSGGGFPGLVIAIMSAETDSPTRVTLVESDARKSAFLRTVIRETDATASVLTDRIENLPSLRANVISARALTDLTVLLGYANTHLSSEGTCLFQKGKTWLKEVSEAESRWNFRHQVVKSKTETGPVILRIKGVSSV